MAFLMSNEKIKKYNVKKNDENISLCKASWTIEDKNSELFHTV